MGQEEVIRYMVAHKDAQPLTANQISKGTGLKIGSVRCSIAKLVKSKEVYWTRTNANSERLYHTKTWIE